MFLHTLPIGFSGRKGSGIENVYRIDTLASLELDLTPCRCWGRGLDSEINARKVRVTCWPLLNGDSIGAPLQTLPRKVEAKARGAGTKTLITLVS